MPLTTNIFFKRKELSFVISPPGDVLEDNVSDSGDEEYISPANNCLLPDDDFLQSGE